MSNSIVQHWFDPLPIAEYLQEVANTTPDKVKECPGNTVIGQPAVSVACGPNIRFCGSLEDGRPNYRGTILLVVQGEGVRMPELSFYIGPANGTAGEVQVQEGTFPGTCIHQEQDFVFFRYTIDLQLQQFEQKVKYAVNAEHRPDFQFFVPARDQSMNILSYSCNGFSMDADFSSFRGSLWLDVLRRHNEFHYHVMLGGGDQIYCDSIKEASEKFKHWLKHKHTHGRWTMTAEMHNDLENYYLHHYMAWFGKGYMRVATAPASHPLFPKSLHQIPQVNIFDDHDIIDGFGSYRSHTMSQSIFMGVGNAAFKYYMLFQHHTPQEESPDLERSWISGAVPGPYIHHEGRSVYARLGQEIALLGLDCRTERTKKSINSEGTYQRVFARLQQEVEASQGQIKHLLVMLGVPICYPRLVWAEILMESKILDPIKWLAQKGIILKGLVNEFDGSVELLDDLNDHWCAKHHKKERNWLMGQLEKFAAAQNVRITILSGDVHLCCMSRFRTKGGTQNPRDPKFILNLISSAIINVPPPDGMATLLNARSKVHHYDAQTDEDMIPLFGVNTDGSQRGNKRLLNQRNFSDLIMAKNLGKTDAAIFAGVQPGALVLPGCVNDVRTVPSEPTKDDPDNIGYLFEPESLVATLHVEKNREDVSSETTGYQTVVPVLSK